MAQRMLVGNGAHRYMLAHTHVTCQRIPPSAYHLSNLHPTYLAPIILPYIRIPYIMLHVSAYIMLCSDGTRTCQRIQYI
jgi:hypothetical protein